MAKAFIYTFVPIILVFSAAFFVQNYGDGQCATYGSTYSDVQYERTIWGKGALCNG